MPNKLTPLYSKNYYKKENYLIVETVCYGPSVISVTVTKGGYLRGGGLYGTSGTMGRGVSRVMWTTQYAHEVGTWEREYAIYSDQ